MDWATLRAAIPLVVQTAAGDPTLDVGWHNREARWRNKRHVRLRVLGLKSKGRDERRYTPEGENDMRERVYGVRVLRVQISCETQDQDLDDSAMSLAEDVAIGLTEAASIAALDSAGVGVATIGDRRPVDYMDEHGRWRSAVVFEVALNGNTSRTGVLIPSIKKIEFTGNIENGPDIGPETVEDGA